MTDENSKRVWLGERARDYFKKAFVAPATGSKSMPERCYPDHAIYNSTDPREIAEAIAEARRTGQ